MSKLTRYIQSRVQPLFAAYLFGADEKYHPTDEYCLTAESQVDSVGKLLTQSLLPEAPMSEPKSLSGSISEFRQFLQRELLPSGLLQLDCELRCAARDNPPAIVAEFENGRVLHSRGAVIDRCNRLVWNMSGINKQSDIPGNPLSRGKLSAPKKYSGTLALLTGSSPQNVFHWYMDILPMLSLYEASGVKIDRYYVPTKYRHQRESLERLGIAGDRIVHATGETHVECENLVTASFEGGKLNRYRVEAARALLQTPSDGLESRTPKRIYVSRRKARVRRVENEENVFQTLKKFGFQRYCLEDMSIADQVKLFESATMVIAPHGAGLTNTCFCAPGTVVMELNTPVRISSLFLRIANVCGLEYHLHIAKPCKIKHFDPETALGDSNLLVEESSLEQAVRSILNGSRNSLYSCSDLIEGTAMRWAS
ncbi:hypothetical protein VN12_04590 [Pirellula sp. SH-Sr6A]|uniref:glycosyltransferase family 61 protein n=1 Tax=Pirellula sp. SH-Sr6A TaxID=1632865 RepID=UPI00078E1A26|nr:glycosyltransferase family 61 protein [Pirellula sp. SH-Sr6A]AMV31372.1 hypothetical protein VN12_04590 [Pirellula sp. SH-Sr6A]